MKICGMTSSKESYNQVQVRFWMMGFLLLNILLGIVGTFWFRTQHRRAESALRIAVGSSRIQLWQRLNKEGLLLLTSGRFACCCDML